MPTSNSFTPMNPDVVSPLRLMHSLREKHARVLVNALSQLPDIWSLERYESYDGDLSLMLTLEHQEDENLFVTRTADGFHLIANHDDDCRELGCVKTIDELEAAVRSEVVSNTKRNNSVAERI